jgi:hypothetical protein
VVERPAKILVVDDVPENVRLLEAVLVPRLRGRDYESAIAFEADTAWLTRAGFAGYLEKPIDVESFPHHVQRFCA